MTTPTRRPPAKRKPPISRKDDITEWQDNQPVIEVITDEDDIFTESGDNTINTSDQPPIPETAPKIPTPIAAKARELAGRLRNKRPVKKATSRAPKPRIAVDKLISTGWQLLAQLTAPINTPVAKVIDMQAPVAGMILEDAVKNTAIDRILQPLARAGDGGQVAFALMGPPLIVAAITQRPQAIIVLRPVLRASLMTWIEIAGPHLEAVQKKEAEFQEKYGQQVDAMIDYFLAGIKPTEPSPNGANASVPTATPHTN